MTTSSNSKQTNPQSIKPTSFKTIDREIRALTAAMEQENIRFSARRCLRRRVRGAARRTR